LKAYLDAFSLPSPSYPDANHDAYFALPQQQAAGVFDGVGRSAGARLAAITARDSFVQRIQTPLRSRPQFVADAFSSAYTAVLNVADSNPGAGYTGAAALVVWVRPRGSLVWGNVGDCRLYHLASGCLALLSSDDSVLEALADKGVISREEANRINARLKFERFEDDFQRYLAQRKVYIRDLGHRFIGPEPSAGRATVRRGDLLLLCSDGVYDNLPDQRIAELLRQGELEGKAEKLVRAALAPLPGGGLPAKPDDATAVVMQIAN